MINSFHEILIGQILGDAHIEKGKSAKNCRISFSFGRNYYDYANWIHSILKDYCSRGIYFVNINNKDKQYINYRLKTKSLPIFNYYHDAFYQYHNNRYRKIIPRNIKIRAISLAHLIIGDGNISRDGRVRIYTLNYTYEECIYLSNSITNDCKIINKVVKDRTNIKGISQYIVIIPKSEIRNLQNKVVKYIHESILYRVGINKEISLYKI